MTAQVIMSGGPLDGQIISVLSVDGEWPEEIRGASGSYKHADGKIESYFYAYAGVEKAPGMLGPVWFGSYEFVGIKESYTTLITVWEPTKEKS